MSKVSEGVRGHMSEVSEDMCPAVSGVRPAPVSGHVRWCPGGICMCRGVEMRSVCRLEVSGQAEKYTVLGERGIQC